MSLLLIAELQGQIKRRDERIAELEAQRRQEPAFWQYQAADGEWNKFDSEAHQKNTIEDGRCAIRALYTSPTAQPVQPVSDDTKRANRNHRVKNAKTARIAIDAAVSYEDLCKVLAIAAGGVQT